MIFHIYEFVIRCYMGYLTLQLSPRHSVTSTNLHLIVHLLNFKNIGGRLPEKSGKSFQICSLKKIVHEAEHKEIFY